MLDTFEIITTSGVVLWSRTYTPVNRTIINDFISDVFIEEKGDRSALRDSHSAATNPVYKVDAHTVRWAQAKELGVIFVVVYRSLLHLTWVDKLVDNIRTIFVQLYGDQLKKPHTTLIESQGFDGYFDQQLRELDTSTAHGSSGGDAVNKGSSELLQNSNVSVDVASEDAEEATSGITSTSSELKPRPSTPSGKVSRRARKAMNNSRPGSPASDVTKNKKSDKPTKKNRKWDADGMADEDDDVQLDYSAQATEPTESSRAAVDEIDASTWGTSSKGKFVLKDLGDEVHDILASASAEKANARNTAKTGILGSGVSAIGGIFRNVIGGKTLNKEDLAKAMKEMEDHLLRKNVAREAAIRLCEGVSKELVGTKTGSFESTNARIQSAMEASLTKMLTPTSSLDLLREIDAVTAPPITSMRARRPYVMSIVGVNGVGKSTNLSKICFFLLQNKYKVLIAAGDTFRSGAVEQLAVHVRNLKELTEREGGQVDLYQKGYGKDAATVAKDAVTYAAQSGYDVVLIDTAGRRHNDQRLMSSLEKFAKFAQPDKIIMVGEALVGTDSVAQARNFNSAFGSTRSLDGFLISKCDTVGDMVGTLVSLVHATGVPVLFVGVGQHYSDLRNFSVKWAVEKLLTAA